jgi:squalene monooxygenase
MHNRKLAAHQNPQVNVPDPFFLGSTDFNGVGLHNGRFLQKIREDILKNDSITQIHGTVYELMEDSKGVVTGVKYREKHTRDVKAVKAKLTTYHY